MSVHVHESCWICVWKKFSNTEVIFWQKAFSSSSQEQCEYLQKGGHGHPQKWQIMVMEALSLCLLALASWRETAHGKLYKKGDSKQWERERVRQVKSNDDHVPPSSARRFNGQSFNLCWCWSLCSFYFTEGVAIGLTNLKDWDIKSGKKYDYSGGWISVANAGGR